MVEKFLVLLILASQRIEDIMGWDLPSDTTKRGSLPSLVEYFILAYVAGAVLCAGLFRAITANLTLSLMLYHKRAFLESQYHKFNWPSQAFGWYPVSVSDNDNNNCNSQQFSTFNNSFQFRPKANTDTLYGYNGGRGGLNRKRGNNGKQWTEFHIE